MDTIATTFPDIPRIYTAIAEWATCLLFIFFMPRKYDKAMTAGIAAAFLALQSFFLVVTANVPLLLWIPCMLVAFGLMFAFLAMCMDYPYHICLYYTLLSIVTAEFMASVGWQIVRGCYRAYSEMNRFIAAAVMALVYGLVLALISPMHVVDICTIFGNALENAIECEATVQERGRRWIHMLVTEKKGFVYTEISNYCEGEIAMKDGLPVTTKEDRKMHGYGVRSIRYAAAKYGGSITYEQGDEQFAVKILIPKPITQSDRHNPVL